MGLTKLLERAGDMAEKELNKRMAAQQAQQYHGGQQHPHQAYAPPTVVAAPAGFSAPPPRAHAPAPSASLASGPPAAGGGRKKALLIACSYPGTRSMLRGPGNDVQCMHFLLTNKLGFDAANIVVLRDDDLSRGPDFFPTRAVVTRACSWLVADARPGDSLFWHYSGHGSRQKDPTRQEETGYDGTILPTDFKQAGQITDTELARLMVHALPAGVVLHALFDSCHSGTMLDLPFDTQVDKTGGVTAWRRTNMRGTSGGTVIQLGACDDKQTAADTSKLSATAYTGAATYAFIASIERHGAQQTYASLLSSMTATLRSLGKASVTPPSAGSAAASSALPLLGAIALGPLGLVAGFAMAGGMDASRMSEQRPMLCCDKPMNLHEVVLMV